jgi:VWFA-related protein
LGELDPGVLRSVLAQAITARGMTALYDAVLAGLQRVSNGTHTRQVLIVVSDGGDNASAAPLPEMLQQVHDSDATVYTVILTDPLSRDSDPRLMRRLATVTGGESYHPRHISAISGVLERIATDIRSAYTLAYAPTRTGADGEARRTVRVRARSPDGRALTVRTRDGYFARRVEGQGPRP